jgi:hypothetical protein
MPYVFPFDPFMFLPLNGILTIESSFTAKGTQLGFNREDWCKSNTAPATVIRDETSVYHCFNNGKVRK